MVGSGALGDQTLVALHTGVDSRLLDVPLTNIAKDLALGSGLLGGLTGSPACRPVVSKLLQEGGLDRGGLSIIHIT